MKKFLSIALALLLICSVAVACVACQVDKDAVYDKVTKTLKLSKSYEGKSFIEDGIGEANLVRHTDGDTTSFRLKKEGTVITIRYHSIDTPESTGSVEKWGKAASNFVKKMLTPESQIVLESHTGGAAKKDNYGVRYLGYVWFRNSETEDFKCLNLLVVENGYSLNKGTFTSEFPYYTYFDKAENAASKKALHIHSNDDDPLYIDTPIDTTVKELNEKLYNPNVELYPETEGYDAKFFDPNLEMGAKVRFTAYIEDVTITTTYTFSAASYDPVTGEHYAIDLFCMYVNNQQSQLHLGGLYQITGVIQKNGNGFQLTDIKYDTILLERLKDNSIEKQTDYYLTFDSSIDVTPSATRNNYRNTFFTDVTVESVGEVVDGVLTFTGKAAHKKVSGGTDEEITFTFSVKVGTDSYQSKIYSGATLKLCGYQFETGSHKITIASLSAIK